MYRAFELTLKDNTEKFEKKGQELSDLNSKEVKKVLDSFLLEGKTLDGTAIQKHWFPAIKSDVFISHSHHDEVSAKALAGWLSETFGLRPFLDSVVWGYSDDLLKQIDDTYCLNEGGATYSYQSRNGSTSHVHMMLSTALNMMIDSSECLIFLNTPDSIASKDAVYKTKSPWIFYELATIQTIRRKTKQSHRGMIKKALADILLEAKELDIEYEVDTSSLTKIDIETLNQWAKAFKNKEYALDVLYEIKPN